MPHVAGVAGPSFSLRDNTAPVTGVFDVYRLEVIHPDGRIERVTISRASDVLDAIPGLLAQHTGCDRIIVYADAQRLFAVDCQGNQLPLD